MRFNHKELAAVAIKASEEFDKEGLLLLKEKEGLFFQKSESYSEKLFRLKGNLLFYFKTKDKNSELGGVVILERFKVEPDATDKEFGFCLDFDEEDEQKYELAAKNRKEMESWIEAIKAASYEQLRFKLIQLRQEIMMITGQDPLPDYHPLVEQNPMPSCRVSIYSPTIKELEEAEYNNPMLEICITCSNLISPCEGSKPAAFVKVYGMTPPDTKWVKVSQTEVAEEGTEADFLKTIVLHWDISEVTRLKFVVFDVRSRSKQDVLLLGQAVCTVKEVQNATDDKLSLTLMNIDSSSSVGKIDLQAWKREKSNNVIKRQPSDEFRAALDEKTMHLKRHIKTYICNVVERSFRFPTQNGEDLKFQELMGESILCFRIPLQLLTLFIKEEKEAVVELHNLGSLHLEWENVKEQLQNSHFDLVHLYSTFIADLSQFEGRNFKKSAEKNEKELEFISTNLHLQRVRIVDAANEEFVYDIVTSGAPTAYPHKYRHGGLKRMLASAAETSRRMTLSPGDSEKTKAGIKVRNMKSALRKLLGNMKDISEKLRKFNGNNESFGGIAMELSNKVGELLNLHSSSFMTDVETSLMRARVVGPFSRQRTVSAQSQEATNGQNSNVCQWQWNGAEFRRSLAIIKDLDCGVRDALAKMMATVHNVMNDYGVESSEEIKASLSEEITSVVMCCESLVKKLIVSMRFILMQEEASAISTLKDVRYRRDVVFSQALTPVVAGFVVKLSQNIHNQVFLQQIAKIGLLVHTESLLTTHGDEMGMIEDMVIGLKDLRKVKLKLVANDNDDSFPTVSGSRASIIIEIPIHPYHMAMLPTELQCGALISVVPVLFSVGINEQATLAERFGDVSLQEEINSENLNVLYNYYTKFFEKFPEWKGFVSGQLTSLPMLMTQLLVTIQSKKSKNYDILLVSEEICWRLNAIRITSCKSAKDRSSMAVTLEIAKILEREHHMRENVFHKVLATLRSQGTRLVNVHKNIGFAKYAFNLVQVKSLPYDYRPTEGTYGKNIQT